MCNRHAVLIKKPHINLLDKYQIATVNKNHSNKNKNIYVERSW